MLPLNRLQACLLGCVALSLLTGCSDGKPERVPVSGRVLIDGQPLKFGFVQVVPPNARAATGKIGPDGTFSLTTFTENDGCVPGKHPAAVIATESINATSQKWHAPKDYVSIETSKLEVNITGPTKTLEINLSWNGGAPFVENFAAEK